MTSEEKQKAIDALKISAPAIAVKHEEFNDYIQTLNKIMDWLEQEPTTKNDLGVDTDKLISDCEKMSFDIDFFNKPLKVVALDAVKNIVNDLPSVTPQERKGHWIINPKGICEHLICDKCLSNAPYNCRTNYCPECGAKMFEPQESEIEDGQ